MVGRATQLDGSGQHRAVQILARSISRELQSQGYQLCHLIDLAGELIEVACDSLRDRRDDEADGDRAPARRSRTV